VFFKDFWLCFMLVALIFAIFAIFTFFNVMENKLNHKNLKNGNLVTGLFFGIFMIFTLLFYISLCDYVDFKNFGKYYNEEYFKCKSLCLVYSENKEKVPEDFQKEIDNFNYKIYKYNSKYSSKNLRVDYFCISDNFKK
jgi:hypothetical protein